MNLKRLFFGRGSSSDLKEIDERYFKLSVDIWAATRNYGIFAVVAFLSGLYVLNLIGDRFRNPYTKIVTPEGLLIAVLGAFFVWAGSALMIVLWTHHVGNTRHSAKYGQFTWRLKSGKYIFNFHGWIQDIVKLTGEEIKVVLGQKIGEIMETVSQEFSLNMFMFYLNEQPFERFLYLSPANDVEELAKFVEGTIVAGTGWRGWWIGAQVHPFDMGQLLDVKLEDELIPIMYPCGDHFQYMKQLQGANLLHITPEIAEKAKITAYAIVANQYKLELDNKNQIIEAYQKSSHNYEGDVASAAARLRELEKRRRQTDRPVGVKLTRNQAILLVGLTVLSVFLIVYFIR